MGNLVDHARSELERAGLFDLGSDYDGMLGKAVLELVEKLAAQGHSGFSAHQTIRIFSTVAKFEVLPPVTSDPEEWEDVSDFFGEPQWQNRRQSSLFSKNGGKTWWHVDHPPLKRRVARGLRRLLDRCRL